MDPNSGIASKGLLLIGSLGPLGHLPASGTVTVAIVGLPVYWAFHVLGLSTLSSLPFFLVGLAVFVLLSVFIHERGDRILGEKDSRKIVWDELAGFFLAVTAVPFTWQLALIAFLLERALDISKFPPAGWVERRVPGGWGVVGDDLVAGGYTCLVLHGLCVLTPSLVGLPSV